MTNKNKIYYPFDTVEKLSKCHNVPLIKGTNLCMVCKKPTVSIEIEKKVENSDITISKENPFK